MDPIEFIPYFWVMVIQQLDTAARRGNEGYSLVAQDA